RPPSPPTPLPYTTLFRSGQKNRLPNQFNKYNSIIPKPRRVNIFLTVFNRECRSTSAEDRPNDVSDRKRLHRWRTFFLSGRASDRSEEHTSELQSRENLVC